MCEFSIAKMTVNPVQMLAWIAEATDARPHRRRAVFKRTKDYRAVFRELRALTNITWKTIVSDFEVAVWNATREIFPGTVHRLCFFPLVPGTFATFA